MPTVKVDLAEMLAAREARAAAQQELLGRYGKPLVCLTMNIPGEVKNAPLIQYAFSHAVARIRASLADAPLCFRQALAPTGCEAFFVYDLPAAQIKQRMVAIEEAGEIGRLFDIDVLDAAGGKLSRPLPRACVICGGPAAVCARSRAHGLPALVERVAGILVDFASRDLAERAVGALVDEARFTPKPGLVDRRNNGAHPDMDLALLERSAAALQPWFERFVRLGLADAAVADYRRLGLGAERDMLRATRGVNTHKGAVYALGLLLSAYGLLLGGHREAPALDIAAALARALAASGAVPQYTHGAAVRRRYQAGGAQAQAAAGFPQARRCCAVLRSQGRLPALLTLLAETEDSNVLWRGGRQAQRFLQAEAASILRAPAEEQERRTICLDDICIAKNISPGGCADLFALALFLENTESILPFSLPRQQAEIDARPAE